MPDLSETLRLLRSRLERLEKELSAARMREVRRSSFEDLCARYSALALEAGGALGLAFPARGVRREDFGYAVGIVRPAAVDELAGLVRDLAAAVARALEARDDARGALPCWKLLGPCSKHRELDPRRYDVFFAFPFSNPPSCKTAVNLLCEWLRDRRGVPEGRIFRADTHSRSTDFACEICKGLQESSVVVADVTGLNANVHCELGMAFGLGKPIIVLRDELKGYRPDPGDSPLLTGLATDIQSLRYIEYGKGLRAGDRDWIERRFAQSFDAAMGQH